jgi:O-antigen/teichoic acid export membrane protein
MIRGWGAAARRQGLLTHLRDPLYRTGYLLTLGTAVTSLLGFVFWVLVARGYTARVVGANAAAISAMMFLANACQLGLPAVLVRDLPAAGERAGGLIVRSYAVMFVAALALGLGAALSSHLWSHSLGFLGREPEWLIGFPLATAFFTIFQAQDWVMTGLEGARWVPIENSLFSLAKLALLLAVVAIAPFAGPFIAWSVPGVAAALLITGLIFRRLLPAARRRPERLRFDARRFVRMAAANQLALLFTYAVTLLMPVVVAAEKTAATAAYFYVPWTIAVAIQVFAVNTSTSLTVEATLDQAQLARLTRRTLLHTLRFIVPVALVVLTLAPYGLRLFGAGYATHGATLLRLLALASLPNAVYTVGEALLRIQHRPLLLIVSQGGQAVLFFALSLWLLPSRGIDGVGIAFLVSQLAVGGALLVSTMRPLLRASGGVGRDC